MSTFCRAAVGAVLVVVNCRLSFAQDFIQLSTEPSGENQTSRAVYVALIDARRANYNRLSSHIVSDSNSNPASSYTTLLDSYPDPTSDSVNLTDSSASSTAKTGSNSSQSTLSVELDDSESGQASLSSLTDSSNNNVSGHSGTVACGLPSAGATGGSSAIECGVGWTSLEGKLRLSADYLVSAWLNTVATQDLISVIQRNDYLGLGKTMTFDGLQARFEYRF